MILGVIALLGMLTIGIILLVHYLRRPAQPPGQTGSRLTSAQVLAERFAHGVIDEDEYTSRLAVLRR